MSHTSSTGEKGETCTVTVVICTVGSQPRSKPKQRWDGMTATGWMGSESGGIGLHRRTWTDDG